MNAIISLQEECEKKTRITKKTVYVLLPDQDSAYLLL